MPFFSEKIPKEARYNYKVDSIASLLYGLGKGGIIPFMAVIALRIGATPFLVSLIVAAPYISFLLTAYWATFMEHRKKAPFVYYGCTASRLLLMLMFFVASPEYYALLILAFFIIENISFPAYVAITYDIYPDSHRAAILGYIRTGTSLTWIISTLAAGYLLKSYSYRYVFPAFALVWAISAVYFSKINEGKPDPQAKTSLKGVFSVLLHDRRYRNYLAAIGLAIFGGMMALPLLPILMVSYLRLDNFGVGIVSAVYTMTWIFAYSWWGMRMDRKTFMNLIYALVFLAAVPVIYFFTSSIYIAALSQVALGMGMVGLEIGWHVQLKHFAQKSRITAYSSLQIAMWGAAGLIAPFAGVALMNLAGIRAAFIASFCVSALGVLALWAGRKDYS